MLPFKNMSSDKEQDYFSDGITEELLNLLAKVPKLRVIARTSSFAYKDKDVGVAQIARELRVSSVLEGSVRKNGDMVRITVQLIRASDGTHLWSETYDRTLEDIFKVQDEIAQAVVSKLQGTLLGVAAVPIAKPVDPRVYPQILRAQALLNTTSKEARAEAIKLLEAAIAISPDEPRAWMGLTRAYLNQSGTWPGDREPLYKLARNAAEKAIALDPTWVSSTRTWAVWTSSRNADCSRLRTNIRAPWRSDPTTPRYWPMRPTCWQRWGATTTSWRCSAGWSTMTPRIHSCRPTTARCW